MRFPSVPAEPTKDDAGRALEMLKEVFSEFPFVDDCDRSAALAATLTSVVRPSLRTAPMFATRATDMATGKGLISDILSLVGTGFVSPAMSQARNPEEERKRITANLVRCTPVARIDNCDRPLDSAELCIVLTEEIWSDRLLGSTKQVNLPTRVLWLVNGNNLVIGGDLTTRTVICDIDAKMENPGKREFKIKDLRGYVREHRADLVVAALTIMRAYVTAGSPAQGTSVFGRFEHWDARVRAPLIWLDQADPCRGAERLTLAGGSYGQLRAVLPAWQDCFQSRPMAVREVIEGVSTSFNPAMMALRDTLAEVAQDGAAGLNTRKLGNWLGKQQGKIIGGLKFTPATMQRGIARWTVVSA